MLELLKSLVFAVIVVPAVVVIILGLVYGLGEMLNIFPGVNKKGQPGQNHWFSGYPLSRTFSLSQLPASPADIFSYLPHRG